MEERGEIMTEEQIREHPLKETLTMINNQSIELRLLLSDFHISHFQQQGVDMSGVDKMYKEFDNEIKMMKKHLNKLTIKMNKYWENKEVK